MPDWMALPLGIVVLCLVFDDRRDDLSGVATSRSMVESRSRRSLPIAGAITAVNVVVGVILGIAAVVYGIMTLIT